MFVESDVLELKSEYTPDIRKEIVAFANSKGGTIYIGIQDDGSVIGLKESPEKLCEKISSMLHDAVKPDIVTFSELATVEIDGETAIKLTIQRGTKRPYYLADKGLKPSGVYVRLGNTSIPAAETTIRSMIVETDGTCYEDTRSMIQELTFEAAQAEFKRRGLAFGKSQKISLGICDSEGIYSNLGLLLSDQCQHSIKVAVFKGLEKEVFLARKEFNGSLFAQINEAYAFMELNNQVASTFEGLYRHDSQDYSETALREALLNAVVHREYAFSGSILVSIFSNRMEIVSLGGLTSGIEREDIFEGISQTRNAKLANVFYRLELIEAYGTGIRKILHACREKGVEPEFSTTHAAFRVVIPNQNALKGSYSTGNPLKDDQVREAGDSIQDAVYAYVASHEDVSRKLIQETLKLKQTKTITVLKLLEENGRIVRAGQGKNTVYRAAKAKH